MIDLTGFHTTVPWNSVLAWQFITQLINLHPNIPFWAVFR